MWANTFKYTFLCHLNFCWTKAANCFSYFPTACTLSRLKNRKLFYFSFLHVNKFSLVTKRFRFSDPFAHPLLWVQRVWISYPPFPIPFYGYQGFASHSHLSPFFSMSNRKDLVLHKFFQNISTVKTFVGRLLVPLHLLSVLSFHVVAFQYWSSRRNVPSSCSEFPNTSWTYHHWVAPLRALERLPHF